MRYARELVTSTVVGGLFVVVPFYLTVVLLLNGMKSVATLVEPLAALFPASIPAKELFSLVLVLAICFLVGMAVRTPTGHAMRERVERVFFERLPGYSLLLPVRGTFVPGPHRSERIGGPAWGWSADLALLSFVSVLRGTITVGVSPVEIEQLASRPFGSVRKCSRRDLPIAVARREDASTTVAGTMIVAHQAGIRVFGTGGIGGVHRGAHFDVSADLIELGRTPIAVACAESTARRSLRFCSSVSPS